MGHDLWSVILIAGLAGWIFSSIMLMLKAFPEKDVFVASAGIRWGTTGIISFAIWISGLLNA
jgi:hypothetical protein